MINTRRVKMNVKKNTSKPNKFSIQLFQGSAMSLVKNEKKKKRETKSETARVFSIIFKITVC